MTKNKLLELYQRLDELKLPIDLIKKLKDSTDEEIDLILNSKSIYDTIGALTSDSFKKLDINIKNHLISLANNASSEMKTKYILRFYQQANLSLIQLSEVPKLIDKAENISAETIYRLAINKNVIQSKKYLDILNLLSESQNESNIKELENLIIDKNILDSGLILTLIKMILESKHSSIARNAVKIATDTDVLSSGKVIKIIEIVSKLEYIQQGDYLYYIATNPSVLKNKDAIKIIWLASTYPCINKLELVTKISINESILSSGKILEILKLISKVENMQINLFYEVVSNEELLNANKALEFAKLITDSKLPIQISYSKKILENYQIISINRAEYYITKIINAKTTKMIEIYFRAYIEEYENIKNQCDNSPNYQNKKTSETFWELFDSNSKEAISLLIQNINDEEEITSNTKVRRKR